MKPVLADKFDGVVVGSWTRGRCYSIVFLCLENLDEEESRVDAVETVGRLIQNLKKNWRRSEKEVK